MARDAQHQGLVLGEDEARRSHDAHAIPHAGDPMSAIPDDLPRRILDGSPDAVLISDRDGKVRSWNAAAVRLFGFPENEALGASMDLIIPERLRGRHWGGWDHVMASGVTRYGDGQLLAVPALHKDGRQLSVEFSIQLLKDGAGRIEWVVAVFRDVTERFQRDKALKLRLKELEAKGGGQRP
jgi:PAS domain S-box-containing protein